MRIWMLATGAAALAITAPALADRGGHGGGHGGGNNAGAQQVQRGGGHQKASRSGGDGGQVRVEQRGGGQGGGHFRMAQSESRGHGQRVERAQAKEMRSANRGFETHGKQNHGAMRSARIEDRGNRVHDNRQDMRVLRAERNDQGRVFNADRVRDHGRFAEGEKVFKVRDFDHGVARIRDVDRDELFGRRLGYGVGGCPPGLAKKAVPCVPPGQAARFVGQPLSAAARVAALEGLPSPLRSLYYDDNDYYYRYGGGYLYRVDRSNDLISSIVPLFGAALLGQPLQNYYVNPYRPAYFNSFYPDSPYDCYRNGYGYVYQTDCMTGMVEDVIPTYGYGYGVGQMMPASYGYYNVPYAYRGYFPDSGDYYYRYAPGAIYQVDRDTALVSGVAALLTNGLTVGQPLPMGYNAYNVPLAYRTSYYDTPDMWYRYDNGYIYSVDPTTQLVTAIVRALV